MVNLLGSSSALTEILFVLTATVCLIKLMQYHWKRRRLYWMASKIPGPTGFPVIGSCFMFTGSTEQILLSVLKLFDSYRSPVKLWLGQHLYFATSDPEHLEIIFNNPKTLGKVDFLFKGCYPFVGEGLFSAPVEKWKRNRKIISPAFNQKILNKFVPVFVEQVTVLADILQNHLGTVIDIGHFIDKCSLDIICETSMGVKVNAQRSDSEFGKMVERLLSIFFQRMFQIWYHPDVIFYNTPLGREFNTITNKFLKYTDKVVEEKRKMYYKHKEWARQYPEAQTDEVKEMNTFLELLLELTDGDKFTNKELRDEVNTFIIAGSDTTTSALSFAVLMLGMHPEFQERVYEEVSDVLGSDRTIEFTDLPKLKYTERFIQETNRLFPIGPLVVRGNDDDINLGDYKLPKGSSTALVILHCHRSAKYWPNPLKFDPDRFLPEEVAKRHPYAYVPFTGGPRICIGKRFAMVMLKTCLAHLVRKFKISTTYKEIKDVRLKQDLIMKPVEGYKVKLLVRNE